MTSYVAGGKRDKEEQSAGKQDVQAMARKKKDTHERMKGQNKRATGRGTGAQVRSTREGGYTETST